MMDEISMRIRDLLQRMLRPQFLILLIASTLTLVWFHKGLLLATGENAIIFDRAPTLLETVSNSWGNIELGGPNIIDASGIPLYLLASFMVSIGLPGVFIQASLFWLFLVSEGLSTFYIVRGFVNDGRRELAATIAGLFYMLNPYAMIEIWNRFLYTLMFFYAFMPLILLLYIKGLELRRLKYALYIGLASLLIAYSYGSPPLIGTFWLVIASYAVFHIISNIRRLKIVLFTLAFSALTFIIWLSVNSWWLVLFIAILYPGYVVGGLGAGEAIALEGSKSTLISISKLFGGLINLFRLINIQFLEGMVNVWGPIYFSWGFIAISFLIPILTFVALLFKPRYKLMFYFAILSILGLFLAKGTAPPFGGLFLKVFESFSILQVYRNPFEKLGIILPLGFGTLFGLSVSSIYYWLRKHVLILMGGKRIDSFVTKTAALLLCILVLVVYVWPMWNGYVFTSGGPPENNPEIGYYIKVPEYYAEANKWLSTNAQGYRAIFLPLAPEGMTYTWQYGYSGVELVDQLFDTDVVGIQSASLFYNAILSKIEMVLFSTTNFWKLMSILNAKYIVVRSDIDYEARGVISPEDIKSALNYTIEPSIVNGSVDISSANVKSLIDYDLKDWQMIWYLPDYSLSLDSHGMQSKFGIKVTSGNSGLAPTSQKDYTLNLLYNLPEDMQNLSNAKYLLIWVKSSVPGVIWISISDGNRSLNWWGEWPLRGWNGNSEYNINNEEVNKWKLLILPLDFPTYIYKGEPDLSSIKSMGIVLFTNKNSTRQEYLEVGGIFADSGKVVKVESIHFVKSFGELDVYELNETFLLPRIFAVNRIIIAKDINDFLFNLIPSKDYDPRYEAVVLQQNLTDAIQTVVETLNPNTSIPKIEFVEINPAIWQVNVFNATSPFLLIFSEAYDPMWKAYYGEVSWVNALQMDSIPDKYHFIVNGYANAWYINKTGTYTITLYFKPQSFLVIGSIISALSIIISILGIIYVEHDRFAKFLKTLFTLAQHLKFLSFKP